MAMTTKQLAEQIAKSARVLDQETKEEIYRQLLVFLANDYATGYGVDEGPRGEARRYARDHNYFWLPCIICSTWVAGNEPHGNVKLDECTGVGCCGSSECLAEADRLNKLHEGGIQK